MWTRRNGQERESPENDSRCIAEEKTEGDNFEPRNDGAERFSSLEIFIGNLACPF
jgi:hypothetical protein